MSMWARIAPTRGQLWGQFKPILSIIVYMLGNACDLTSQYMFLVNLILGIVR